MYYSIPGVLKASFSLRDVDYSDITSLSRNNADSHGMSSTSRRSRKVERTVTVQSSEETEEEEDATTSKVTRRTCVSFECHPSVLMEDFINELDGEESMLYEEQQFDDMLLLLTSLSRQ